jgi:ABC-type sugar transport system substrate-binding protein
VEEIAKHPQIEIVDRPSAGGLRDKAYAIAQNMLQAHAQLRGIFAINDDTALGALRAVGEAKVVIVGYDATPEAREAILRDSALKADVVQYPDRIGQRTIERIPVDVGIVDQASLSAGP